MSIADIVAKGAFTVEAYKQDSVQAESIQAFAPSIRTLVEQGYVSWAHAKQRYIVDHCDDVEPTLTELVSNLVSRVRGIPQCLGMPVKTLPQQAAVAKALATVLETTASTALDCVQSALSSMHSAAKATLEEWDERYTAFAITHRWSEIDARIWADCGWVKIDDIPNIVIRTGKSDCAEYRVIGTDPEEILEAFQSRGRTHLIQHFLNTVVELNNMVPPSGHDISVIDGRHLSAACADYLYTKAKKVNMGTGEEIGREIRYTKSGRPTELGYITKSMEAFLKPANYVDVQILANDPAIPCYNYLPLPSTEDTETPVIDAWLADVAPAGHAQEYKDVLAASLACVIVPGNTTRQAKWLHGGGYDGKTVFLSAVARYFGSAACSLQIAAMKDRFGMATIENKRVVLVDDQKDPTIVAQPWFHQASGGSFGAIERKFKQPRSCRMHAHFFIAENIPPNVNVWEANQTSRIVYIRLRKRTEAEMLAKGVLFKDADGVVHRVGDSTFVDKMTTEIPKLLAYGLSIYNRMCPTNGDILVPPCMVQAMYDHCVSPETELLTSYLDEILIAADPTAWLPRAKLLEEFKLKLKNDYRVNQTPTHIERWIEHTYKIELARNRSGSGWYGLKLVESNTISWQQRQFNEDRMDRIVSGKNGYKGAGSPPAFGAPHMPARRSPAPDITNFRPDPVKAH